MATRAAGASIEQRAMRAAAVPSVSRGWTLQSVLGFNFILRWFSRTCEYKEENRRAKRREKAAACRFLEGNARLSAPRCFSFLSSQFSIQLRPVPRRRPSSVIPINCSYLGRPPGRERAIRSRRGRGAGPGRPRRRWSGALKFFSPSLLFLLLRGAVEREREEEEKMKNFFLCF